MISNENIVIFDTTLRDGEQSPGCSMNIYEKLEIARQLHRVGVDVIEAGFPNASQGDFNAVHAIAQEIPDTIICGLARVISKDIEKAFEAVQPAGSRSRIHLFIGTSKIHREYKLKKTADEIINLSVEGIKLAKTLVSHVQFSAEDATRTEYAFLKEIFTAAIEAGATTINVPDTVGYITPHEYNELISLLRYDLPPCTLSVHCHNDLGLALANTLAGLQAGASQVEGTFNGIGERAGNVALEELVMALKTRKDVFNQLKTKVQTHEILNTSRLVARMTGFNIPRNKAIVGENAFAHSSGIHQDGMIKRRETYEIMNPVDIGWGGSELPLTKHSGKNAIKQRLMELRCTIDEQQLDLIFDRFKEIGDKKKFIYDDELLAIVREINATKNVHHIVGNQQISEHLSYSLHKCYVLSESVFSGIKFTKREAHVIVNYGENQIEGHAEGNGSVDAMMKAIDHALCNGKIGVLDSYNVVALTKGPDALAEVTIKINFGDGHLIRGRGASTDILEASAKAYINVINQTSFI